VVDGGTPVEDINELLGLTLPNADWDTVGGFIFGTLEHVPEVGESIVHEGWRFGVDEVDGRRVRRVRISYVSETSPPRHGGEQRPQADAETVAEADADAG
jgi:CBS domain containing-hemolysin-like protein